jgi:sugar O-acyltransferase (sialic acid O-acetyltransferase NeuD family)
MRLALAAGSGLAAEVLTAVRAAGELDDAVVLDDDPARWGTSVGDVPVVGGLDQVRRLTGHQLVVCTGRGASREAIVERFSGEGVAPDRYATIVHPSVDVPPDCSLGAGTVVLAGVVLTAGVRVGRHVVVMPNAVLTHDDVLDDFATVCAGVALGGRVRVGRAAYVGMNASVREGVTVGAGSTLGMGAALLADLGPGLTAVGVPATPIRERRLQEI